MTIIYFILVLGITVFIHELGHFLFAKKAGVYIYEFSIGMGPVIFRHKRKNDDTEYNIRLFPIGGFVSMAGEDVYDDEEIPKDKQLIFKPWKDKFLTMIAGVLFNFLLALVMLFIVGLINGVPPYKAIIKGTQAGYPIENQHIYEGDEVIECNNVKIGSSDKLALLVSINSGKALNLKVKHEDGKIEEVTVEPVEKTVDNKTTYTYGFELLSDKKYGIVDAVTYSFTKAYNLIEQMVLVIKYLILGKVSLSNLSGPIGIYQIVDASAKAGFINIIYLIAYLCINVGFINLLPLPAFDGGRAFFLLVEKITGKKIDSKIENIIHTVGFYLLMLLMILITYNDILRIIKK